ncbi:MAG: universal stress protein [Pelagimonas sp.]|jgi:nucleotide-binding universal stress UspA family protein|nr:universal stress protein [Pelagimonas sp.]
MYQKILVPVAFEEGGKEKSGRALGIAAALLAEGGEISVLHVMEQVPGYVVNYLPADFSREARNALQAELDSLAQSVPNGQGVLVEGHSGRTILDWAEENGSDLIVIASHQPGMQDLLLGSTATQVVRHARCAVHVLR